MPTPQMKSLAEDFKVSVKKVEKYWDEARAIVDKEYEEDDPKYWGTVMNITKNKLNYHKKGSLQEIIHRFLEAAQKGD